MASNYLINGQNIKPDGSAGTRATFNFTPGKKHLLRLINTSVDNHFKFAIDGHTMTVISTDFVPINPYTTDILVSNPVFEFLSFSYRLEPCGSAIDVGSSSVAPC